MDISQLLRGAGSQTLYIEGAIAVGLALIVVVAGWVGGKALSKQLLALWIARTGRHEGQIASYIGRIVRRAVIALLLALVFFAWPWTQLAQVALAATLSVTTALLVHDLVRIVLKPRGVAITMAILCGIAVLTSLVGGLSPVMQALDKVGFDIGSSRFSLRKLVEVTATFIALLAVVRVANRLIAHAIGTSKRLDSAQQLLSEKLAGVAVTAAAFFIGIDILGIDLTALAFFSGAFGLAIGFGMQKTFGNLIAGIILLMDRSIKPGDVIVVGDSFGWVNKIGVRAVSVLTRDGKEHLIPNEILMTEEVENWSYSDKNVRIKIPVGVSYSSDMRLVETLLYRAVSDVDRVLKNPEPKVWMMGFGDSSVDFEIRCWINDPEGGVGNVTSMVLFRVWDLFRENGVEIPFPQRDLHVKSMPDALAHRSDENTASAPASP